MFIVDWCTPRRYIKLLDEWGYQAQSMADYLPVNAPDPEVLALAQKLDAVIVSTDKDFGDITRYPPETCQGIIVIRDEVRARNAVTVQLKSVIDSLYRDKLRGILVTVEPTGYRIIPKG